MTMRCAVCATTEGPFEKHHIALEGNCKAAFVLLCRVCHEDQTRRQRRAGLFELSAVHDPHLYFMVALVQGTAELLIANVQAAGEGSGVEMAERFRRLTLRLLSVAWDPVPGSIGPRPISTDRRRIGTKRAPAPAANANQDPAVLAEGFGCGLFPALAAAISDLIPGTSEAAVTTRLAASAPAAVGGFSALEDHPRADELRAALRHGEQVAATLFEQLVEMAANQALGEATGIPRSLIEAAHSFRAVTNAVVEFFLGLADATSPENVCAALDRFLARRVDW